MFEYEWLLVLWNLEIQSLLWKKFLWMVHILKKNRFLSYLVLVSPPFFNFFFIPSPFIWMNLSWRPKSVFHIVSKLSTEYTLTEPKQNYFFNYFWHTIKNSSCLSKFSFMLEVNKATFESFFLYFHEDTNAMILNVSIST